MRIIQMLFLSFMFLVSTSYAGGGQGGGNGGDVVVCPQQTVLLDMYEAKQRYLSVRLVGKNLREMVLSALKRLERLDSARAKSLMTFADEILTDLEGKERDASFPLKNIVLTADDLVDIADSKELTLPNGCSLKQLVIQKNTDFPNDPRYIINQPLWEALDRENQALTILHEVWLRETIRFNAEDSRMARYLNALFASTEAENTTLNSYFEILSQAKRHGFNMFYYVLSQESDPLRGVVPLLTDNLGGSDSFYFQHLKIDRHSYPRLPITEEIVPANVDPGPFGAGFRLRSAQVHFDGGQDIFVGLTGNSTYTYYFSNGAIVFQNLRSLSEVTGFLDKSFNLTQLDFGSVSIRFVKIHGVKYKDARRVYIDRRGRISLTLPQDTL